MTRPLLHRLTVTTQRDVITACGLRRPMSLVNMAEQSEADAAWMDKGESVLCARCRHSLIPAVGYAELQRGCAHV